VCAGFGGPEAYTGFGALFQKKKERKITNTKLVTKKE